jgi:hypothetical protein
LATKARVHAHDQDQVDLVDGPLQHIQGFGRVEHQPGLDAFALDGLDAAVHMRAGIGVKADEVGTGLCKRRGQCIDGRDHQMHIDRHGHAGCRFGMRLEGLANHGAECEVGHVMVVHHVKVDPVGTGVDDAFDFLAQTGEISREDGRGNAVGRCHP